MPVNVNWSQEENWDVIQSSVGWNKKQDKKTQMFIAKVTTYGFFALLFIPFILLSLSKINLSETIDLIKTIASVLSGIVGLVWGYYFRIPE